MISHELQSKIILSVNRALLGEIFPELYAVACNALSERKFEVVFFVDSLISEDIIDGLSCIETEILADFDETYEISHSVNVGGEVSGFDFLIFLRKKRAC